eukprot:TRINITY_DN1560_c0_g1_i1.p1 TRINITY_DN1560_c0_g1~~TRINITY_DN1560_c0_g1_i1.p1  ORF type:complete len:114 (+),score=15.76 TRINITY_DN1560_c0_g1_i1:117-458(+)
MSLESSEGLYVPLEDILLTYTEKLPTSRSSPHFRVPSDVEEFSYVSSPTTPWKSPDLGSLRSPSSVVPIMGTKNKRPSKRELLSLEKVGKGKAKDLSYVKQIASETKAFKSSN